MVQYIAAEILVLLIGAKFEWANDGNFIFGSALRWHDVECGSSAQFFNLNAAIGVVPESAAGSQFSQSGNANAIKTTSGGSGSSGGSRITGIQISASAGAASSSFGGSTNSAFGGASISASASASSSTFAAGNKQAGGSKQASGSKQGYNY